MGFFGLKLGSTLARLGRKAFSAMGIGAKLGTKALHHASKIPMLQERVKPIQDAVNRGQKVYDQGKKTYDAAQAAYGTAKDVGQRGMSLLRGDLSQAQEIVRGGHNVLQASQKVASEARDTIQKAKAAHGQGYGLRFV